MKRLLDKVEKSYTKYIGDLSLLEKEVKKRCNFNLSVVYQEGDGFCILNIDTNELCSLYHIFYYSESVKMYAEDLTNCSI